MRQSTGLRSAGRAAIPPLAVLFGVVIILGRLVGFETVRYAETRRGLRSS